MLNTFQRKLPNNFLCHFLSVDRGRPQFDLFPHLAAWSQNGEPSSFKIRNNIFGHSPCIFERNWVFDQENIFFDQNSESPLASASLADRHFAGNGEKEILKMSNLQENLRKPLRNTGTSGGKFETWFDSNIYCRWQASSRSLFRRLGNSGKCEQDQHQNFESLV